MNSKNVREENALEEASELLETCIKCGMCKSLCPVFKVLKEEEYSPRGHSILITEKILSKSFFKCTMCKACEYKCPLNLKICDAILKVRESMSLKNKNTKENEEMIEKIRKTGNPFGGEIAKGDKLYCC
ncbi:MAG: (Fe-S)-binding protein [Candidatus Pacearchaeota archaeon]